MADYRTWVQQMGRTNEVRPVPDGPSDLDLLTDIIMKRLRTSDGLDLEWIQKRFGPEQRKTIVKGAQLGLEMNMARIDKDSARLYLIDPEGFLYSNYIISSIFAELGYE
jgi:oxygen-independent coproporphyrinogen-3 oxidase